MSLKNSDFIPSLPHVTLCHLLHTSTLPLNVTDQKLTLEVKSDKILCYHQMSYLRSKWFMITCGATRVTTIDIFRRALLRTGVSITSTGSLISLEVDSSTFFLRYIFTYKCSKTVLNNPEQPRISQFHWDSTILGSLLVLWVSYDYDFKYVLLML